MRVPLVGVLCSLLEFFFENTYNALVSFASGETTGTDIVSDPTFSLCSRFLVVFKDIID